MQRAIIIMSVQCHNCLYSVNNIQVENTEKLLTTLWFIHIIDKDLGLRERDGDGSSTTNKRNVDIEALGLSLTHPIISNRECEGVTSISNVELYYLTTNGHIVIGRD